MGITATHHPSRWLDRPLARGTAAGLLTLHGVAHLVGVQSAWNAASTDGTVDYLFGTWQISGAPLHLLALLWAATAVGYAAAAVHLASRRHTWPTLLAVVTSASLLLSLLALPQAVAGVGINLLLLTALSRRTAPET